jgi:hypothetical protein
MVVLGLKFDGETILRPGLFNSALMQNSQIPLEQPSWASHSLACMSLLLTGCNTLNQSYCRSVYGIMTAQVYTYFRRYRNDRQIYKFLVRLVYLCFLSF